MKADKSALNQKPFILIVDDVMENLQILGNFLRTEGYLFTPAVGGHQALKIIERRLPDLILLDIVMPEINGYEVCSILKKSLRTKDIPIIFLTAKTDTEDIARGFEAGGVDYIAKPFDTEELLAKIGTHLQLLTINHQYRELLHLMSHDLANLFLPILSGLNMLDDRIPSETLRTLRTAVDNGMNLICLARNLWGNKMDSELRPVNLREAIDISQTIFERSLADKQIEFIKNIEGNLSVYAEPVSLINIVFNNILSNAVKFSFRGSKIIFEARQIGDTVAVMIRDFGVGMPEELKKDIFHIQNTFPAKGTEGETGIGFGMPTVRKFVNLYNGKIEVFSKQKEDDPLDYGTEIRLILKSASPDVPDQIEKSGVQK